MDDNTLKAILAALGVVQVTGLGYLTWRTTVAAHKVGEVHRLVNGLAHESMAAATDAASARGELAGRDYAVEHNRIDQAQPKG